MAEKESAGESKIFGRSRGSSEDPLRTDPMDEPIQEPGQPVDRSTSFHVLSMFQRLQDIEGYIRDERRQKILAQDQTRVEVLNNEEAARRIAELEEQVRVLSQPKPDEPEKQVGYSHGGRIVPPAELAKAMYTALRNLKSHSRFNPVAIRQWDTPVDGLGMSKQQREYRNLWTQVERLEEIQCH